MPHAMNLLEYFSLAGYQVVKIGGELFRQVPQSEHCQARVELNLTPQAPDGPAQFPGGFVIAVRFGVLGLPPFGAEDERLFALEVILNAAYRQELGAPIEFHEFQQHHTSLARQLFPLLQSHARQLLDTLGLQQVRLPIDLFTRPDLPPPQVH
jgi:hypothetical protein